MKNEVILRESELQRQLSEGQSDHEKRINKINRENAEGELDFINTLVICLWCSYYYRGDYILYVGWFKLADPNYPMATKATEKTKLTSQIKILTQLMKIIKKINIWLTIQSFLKMI